MSSSNSGISTLLEYEQDLYREMYFNEAALLIMAEGLGVERVFLNFLKLYSDPSHLVLVLNTHEADEDYFLERLKEERGTSIYGHQLIKAQQPKTSATAAAAAERLAASDSEIEVQLPTRITTETHSVAERVETYLKGGCFFVTSRILVVDMLTDRIPIELVSGILVYNAHRVIDSCQETFILRMFRQKNKKGFIKAFSDNPVFFTRGFSKVEKVMKNLFCTKLFIYPRFHVDVDVELSRHKPELVELHVGLSENTTRIQMALLDIINVLLKEFKDCCSYIDHDFLTMEMVISRPFDQLVKSQLDPVWNQLGSKPKQLISDIKTLRLLIYYLTQYDCITFYRMLNCLKSYEKEMGRSTSGWMFLDAANELFSRARLRVYGNETKTYTKTDLNNRFFYTKENADLVSRIIQESPKLKTLKEIIEELESEDNVANDISILIVAKDDRTCSQIKHFLGNNKLTRSIRSNKEKAGAGGGSEESQKSEKEQQLDKLVVFDDKQEEKEDEFIVKMIIRPMVESEAGDAAGTVAPGAARQKQTLTQLMRRRRKKDVSSNGPEEIEIGVEEPDTDESVSSLELNEEDLAKMSCSSSSSSSAATTSGSSKKNKLVFLCALEDSTKQKVGVLKLLYQTKPKYIILYDSVLWFVRQLEIYKAVHYELAMRVYFMIYSNSCEEQRYLTAVRCEKESFEILIREKATMIIPNEQSGGKEPQSSNAAEESTDRQPISEQAKSLNKEATKSDGDDEEPRIIVDIREFRSELPSILHKKGFRIEPVTLEVGDYVLTPQIAVERKSINDLIESLSNGRLYNQVNAMSRSYKYPLLLIEFDQKKPFQLNSYQSLASNEISPQHVSSKLVLLTIHFPRLRILWASNCSETADIFDELKSGFPQPSAEAAMAIKTDFVTEDDDLKYNPVLKDILLKIPGINSKNVGVIMSSVSTLLDLCNMSEEDINKIVENSKNAKLIYEFINKSIKNDSGENKNEFGFEDLNDFYVPRGGGSDEPAKNSDLLRANPNKKARTTTKKSRK